MPDEFGNPLPGEEGDQRQIDQLRARADQASDFEKQLAKERKRTEDLAAKVAEFESAQRTSSVRAEFRQAGLQESWAAFYPGDAPVEADAIRRFAEEHKLAPAPKAEEQRPQEFGAPIAAGGPPAEGHSFSNLAEFKRMYARDPGHAMRELERANSEGWLDEIPEMVQVNEVAYRDYTREVAPQVYSNTRSPA